MCDFVVLGLVFGPPFVGLHYRTVVLSVYPVYNVDVLPAM